MLLLMLISIGAQPPQRAFANTTYRAVTNGPTTETSVTLADGSAGAVTNAETTEE
jgi:hypothetical protein